MSKFQYKITKINEELQEITFISRWSRLMFTDQFTIALIISSERHTNAHIEWVKGNAILKECTVVNEIAEDIKKILDKYK